MPYTLWHAGVLIGETEFTHDPRNPRHRAGVFIPSAYGRELFPRLTGVLTAQLDLDTELRSRGLEPEKMDPNDIREFFDTTEPGRKFLDVGRALSEVEIRDPRGKPLAFERLAFLDPAELKGLMARAGTNDSAAQEALDADDRQVIVSVTFRKR